MGGRSRSTGVGALTLRGRPSAIVKSSPACTFLFMSAERTGKDFPSEAIHNLRRIYYVLLRDAADVYSDLRVDVRTFARAAIVEAVLAVLLLLFQGTLLEYSPPVGGWQLAGNVGMALLTAVVAYRAITSYRHYLSLGKKYDELLKIAGEVSARP